MQRYNTNWTISQLVRYMDNGKATFENPIQRGVVWDVYRKSLLIHSVLYGYPIPAMYFKIIRMPSDVNTKKKKIASPDIYDNFDGKQRSNAIYEYIKGKFSLVDHMDITPVPDDDGNLEDIRGCSFSALPDWAQERIMGFSLTIYDFDNMSDMEMREFFRRLNNGKSLTSIEITRVQTPCLTQFQTLAQHKAIAFITSKAGKKSFMDENVAMQIYNLITEDAPDFSTKRFREWAKTVVLDDNILSDICSGLDLLYELMDSCEDKQLLKTIKTRTHFVSAAYACFLSCQKQKSRLELYQALSKFFGGSPSVSDEYNHTVGAGSAKSTNIQIRKEIMRELVDNLQEEISFFTPETETKTESDFDITPPESAF